MKFTLSWLKQFLETDASLNEITNKLTMLGLEVEEVIDRAQELAEFEVAEIIETTPHPDADKLRVCKVKTAGEVLSIVCGAPNARAGIKVVLAKVGTLIPNGNFKIKQSKIRGVDSSGMLCSAEELNIKGDSTGIIELPATLNIGDKITEYFGLDDPVIHINITPNRADALGVYGIARDLAAAGMGKLRESEASLREVCRRKNVIARSEATRQSQDENRHHEETEGRRGDLSPPGIATPSSMARNDEACPLFATRVIKNINNTESPKWLKNLLENIGIGSISAVVDVTNYICYSFGQPMHAYDADKITGDLTAKVLKTKEKFAALNDKEYELIPGDLVIRDDKEIHCLAGIIGGKNSACDEKTNRIILEAACFDSKYVARTGRRLIIDTDSRYRFERNVDREFTLKALDHAAEMILSICGGEPSAPCVSGNDKLPIRTIDFPVDFLSSRAGFELSAGEIVGILKKLGFGCTLQPEQRNRHPELDSGSQKTKTMPMAIPNQVRDDGHGAQDDILQIQIPSWRYDVSIKEDIVEEIVRIYGYDKIPMTPLPGIIPGKILSNDQRRNMDLKRLVASNGYTEVVTWSFMDSKKAALFGDLKEALTLQNPISAELNYMRPSILPNLLGMACNNINRSYKDLSFFELGPVFHDADSIEAIKSLAGIRIGANIPKNPHIKSENFNVFDIKSDVEIILAHAGLELDKCQIKPEAPSYYHPGRSGAIMLGKNTLGFFGQVHPGLAEKFNIDFEVMAFEIDLSSLPRTKEKFGKRAEFKTSDYQMITRDYAFVLDDSQGVMEVLNAIGNADKNLIKKVSLFDIYNGDKIEKGKKSVALSVTIQDDNKTLTEEDINQINKLIISSVESKFGGILRE